MKAVLVIDMPNSCSECPCYSLNAQAKRFECDAKLTLKGEIGVVELDKKPTWCPLRPLPPKLDANDWHRMFSGIFSEREAKGYGWNVCLDVITGESNG